MRATDARQESFSAIQSRVVGDRERVWMIFQAHGPCTTRAAAAAAEMSILTLRPRACELVEMGLLSPVGMDHREGVYQAVSMEAARLEHERKQSTQLEMAI